MAGVEDRGQGPKHSIMLRDRPGREWREVSRLAMGAHKAYAEALSILSAAQENYPQAQVRMDGAAVYLKKESPVRRGLTKFKSREQRPGNMAVTTRDCRIAGTPVVLRATPRSCEGRVVGWDVSLSLLMRRSTATSDANRALKRVEILLGGRR